ncbi:beta-glucosidase [Bordetella genomosp. 7]|uniref:GH1 family beta-glucosidase n=1 Tax=Bordetella TaxID=517 RepID=UPI0004B5967E|nr:MULTISPECIES: GH1 family beta-glucosidase [Bordetella]OZI24224.1 beta-glucosidase [Bordetella genomosp. 7]
MNLDRRTFTLMAGLGLAEAALARDIVAGQPQPGAISRPTMQTFPRGFRWGVATAAYQIEGAPDADGKGKSIWDVYAHTPGNMANGDTGDVAIDHYHRYREDIQIIRELGANAYRFSISWPRIFPGGTGRLNEAGMDFYSRLVDTQLEAGIEPFVTLYHWDLPQALQDRGGWQSRDTAKAFADYAAAVVRRLGDRVKHFFTLNELQNFVDMGHQGTSVMVQGKEQRIELAPGLKLSTRDLNQVAHHAVLAHGLAVQAMRASGPRNLQVGPADVLFAAVPVSDTPANVRAAEQATKRYNDRFLDVMLTGRYDDRYLASAGPDAPRFTDEDMRAIGSPLDFVGVNIYVPKYYVEAADNEAGYTEIPTSLSHPRMGSRWHSFCPEVMYWGPRLVNSIWKPEAIYITENGCAADDTITANGRVLDTDRLMYLRTVMSYLHRAIAEGAPVKGNFAWSAFDNLEWTGGYGVRFGLVHVDFATQKRTLKLSAEWYRRAAEMNAVV